MAAKKGGGRPRAGGRPGSGSGRASGGARPGAGAAAKRVPAATGRAPAARPAVPPNKVMLASAPVLTRLSRLPRLLMPVLIGVLVLVGLGVGGVAGLVCLLAVAALLAWLLAAFWPVTPGPGRVLRAAAIVALVVVGVVQAL